MNIYAYNEQSSVGNQFFTLMSACSFASSVLCDVVPDHHYLSHVVMCVLCMCAGGRTSAAAVCRQPQLCGGHLHSVQ